MNDSFFRGSTDATGNRNVLVFRPGQLGDTIVGMPALLAIRRRHPRAPLTLLTDAHPGRGYVSAWDVLGPTGIFSGVLFYHAGSPAGIWLLAHRIRRLAPSRLYYLAPNPRSKAQVRRDRLFFQAICGIKDVCGMSPTDDWVGRRDKDGATPLPSETVRLLRTVEESSADDDGEAAGGTHTVCFPRPVGPREKERVDRLWRESNFPAEAIVVAVAPGSKAPAARWPADRFEDLARRLLSISEDVRLVIVGGPEDRPLAEQICRTAESKGKTTDSGTSRPRRVSNWAGKLTVWESAEALRRCALYVGNNSGPMHLAAWMGTRCVVVSHARAHPGIWEPQGSGHVVLYRQVPCSGCGLSNCPMEEPLCLTSISVDEVLRACVSGLEKTRSLGRSAGSVLGARPVPRERVYDLSRGTGRPMRPVPRELSSAAYPPKSTTLKDSMTERFFVGRQRTRSLP